MITSTHSAFRQANTPNRGVLYGGMKRAGRPPTYVKIDETTQEKDDEPDKIPTRGNQKAI